MALYRIKPGFDPKSASGPLWNRDGKMDYLLGSVFEVEDELSWNDPLVTMDANGNYWYLNPDWVVPAVTTLDVSTLGDEI